MAFDIIKGWPEAPVDYQYVADESTPAVVGQVGFQTSERLVPANYATDGSDAVKQAVFVYDKDSITGKLMGLLSTAIIRMDSTHFAADTYAVDDRLSATGGVFAKVATSQPAIAKVLAYNVEANMLIVLWFGPNVN